MATPQLQPRTAVPAADTIVRRLVPSASKHVALALVEVAGPVHVVEAAPYHRLSFNIGPSYAAEVAGDGLRMQFSVQRHALMVIPAGESFAHSGSLRAGAGRRVKPGRLATFQVSCDLVEQCAMALRLRSGHARLRHSVVQSDEVLRLLAQALLADLQGGSPDGAAASERLAMALVERLLLRSRDTPSAAPAWLERVQAHVEARLAAPLTLEELCAVAGMSLFHFCRMFRESLRMTPHKYILARRMEHARRLLWNERERSVLDVALACGFQSPSHFAAQFKKHTGHTPLQWQRGA